MCGRFNLLADPHLLAEIFELLRDPIWIPRFNIAPSQQILVIRQGRDGTRSGDLLQWGLIPKWADDPAVGSKMTNARADSIDSKPAFREAFRKRRCLIPISGFYEWQHVTPAVKQPWHIFSATGEILALAGIWEAWTEPHAEPLSTCAIVTTEANHVMSDVHHRMPVILPSEAFAEWLDPAVDDPAVLKKWLVACPDEWLARQPVGAVVNSPKNDLPECLKPVKLSRGLFD